MIREEGDRPPRGVINQLSTLSPRLRNGSVEGSSQVAKDDRGTQKYAKV